MKLLLRVCIWMLMGLLSTSVPSVSVQATTMPATEAGEAIAWGEPGPMARQGRVQRRTDFSAGTIFFLVGCVGALVALLVASLVGAIILFALGYKIAALLALSPLGVALVTVGLTGINLDFLAGLLVVLFFAGTVVLAVIYFKMGLLLAGFLALSPIGLLVLVTLLSLIADLIYNLI